MLRFSIISIALFTGMMGTHAVAQVPDPFNAYDAQSDGQNDTQSPPNKPATSAPTAVENPSIDPLYEVLQQGRWTLTGMTAFSYDSTSNEFLDGRSVDNSTYMLRLDAGLGYNLFDGFLVDLVGGAVVRRVARESGASPATDWLIQARGRYTIPMSASVGLTTGLALGGYFGSSERDVQISGATINESTSTYGLATDVLLGFTYALSDHLSLHMLGNFAWFWGKESVPSADSTLSASSMHVGLTLGLGYTF